MVSAVILCGLILLLLKLRPGKREIWEKPKGGLIFGFFTRSFHPCQQFLSYDSVVLKKLGPVGWWVFLRPYMGFEEQISMPESPGCKDWIMYHFSLIFTQTHRVLEQRGDFFNGRYNALTCAVVAGFAKPAAVWRQRISSRLFVCSFGTWQHVDDCVFNCKWFLQSGCFQVCTAEPSDESITPSRHFIDSLAHSTTSHFRAPATY